MKIKGSVTSNTKSENFYSIELIIKNKIKGEMKISD